MKLLRYLLIGTALATFNTQAQPYETITSCCSNPRHANGFYASDLIPRTQFNVGFTKDGARLDSLNATIYLGVSCDVYSPQFGYGSWGWANGGTKVTFVKNGNIGFPQQVPSFQDSILKKCSF